MKVNKSTYEIIELISFETELADISNYTELLLKSFEVSQEVFFEFDDVSLLIDGLLRHTVTICGQLARSHHVSCE